MGWGLLWKESVQFIGIIQMGLVLKQNRTKITFNRLEQPLIRFLWHWSKSDFLQKHIYNSQMKKTFSPDNLISHFFLVLFGQEWEGPRREEEIKQGK
jgi:hypothetical protein